MAIINRYTTPPVVAQDNAPTQTADANTSAIAAGTAVDSQGNKITGFSIPTPPTPTIVPPTTTPAVTPAPTTPAITNDPIAAYYAKLADPGVADQPIKDQIQKNMQSALDAIDQRYVSIYGAEDVNAQDRLGQTRALNARSGVIQSDFGNENTAGTVAINTKARGAIDAAKASEQSAVTLAAQGSLTKLAADEVAARKADALGQAQNAKGMFDKAMQDAQALIPKLAGSGATLTPEQKAVLQRNSGYDEATFDSIYNAALPQNQKADISYHTIKNADGSESLLQLSTKPDGTSTQKVLNGYQTGGQVVKEYGGRPYVQSTDANGNIVLKPVAGFVKSVSGAESLTQQNQAFELQMKQAPAQVSNLKAQGYDYGQIAEYFNKQGIDPGTPAIDDALHRAFSTQTEYEAWKQKAADAKKANATDNLLNALLGSSSK